MSFVRRKVMFVQFSVFFMSILFSTMSAATLMHTGSPGYDYSAQFNLPDFESIEANQWGLTGFYNGDIYSIYDMGGRGWAGENLTAQFDGNITDYATWGYGAFFLVDGKLRHTGNISYDYSAQFNLPAFESIEANQWGLTGFYNGDIYSIYDMDGRGWTGVNLTAQFDGNITDYTTWGYGAFILVDGKLRHTGNLSYDYSAQFNLPEFESITANKWGLTGLYNGDIYSIYDMGGRGWAGGNLTTQYDGSVADYATWGYGAFFLDKKPVNVPEPTSLALLSLGLMGLGFSQKKK